MADVELNSIGNGDGTNYLVRDNTKIPLSGSNQISGDLIPSTDGTVNLGSSTAQWNNAYIKSLTINGVACGNILTHNASEFVLVSDLSTVATSGSYSDLSNKPTIPTVNNATLTIQRNGTTLDTFTANASVDKTINIITTDDTKIPLAGTNALSGSIIPDTDNVYKLGTPNMRYQSISGKLGKFDVINSLNDELTLFSSSKANPWAHGAYLSFFSEDYAGNTQWPNAFRIVSVSSVNSYNYVLLGDSSGNLSWNGQSIQTTSDQRLKQQITQIDDKLLDAWADVNLVQFKYNDAVDQKKDKARLHTGYVVQQIDDACKSHNVDISEYGLYCHEEYPQETEEVEVEQADGTKTKERKVIREASEHYSLRYTEALIVECAYLRKKNKDLQEQLNALSERLEKLENR